MENPGISVLAVHEASMTAEKTKHKTLYIVLYKLTTRIYWILLIWQIVFSDCMKKFPWYSILRKYALSADTFIHLSRADSRETPRFQTGIRRHTTLPVALYVALYAALPEPHSTVCSAPFRTSYYLMKDYARRAIYRLQAGASVSVSLFSRTSLSDNIMRGPYDYRLILKRMYWPKTPPAIAPFRRI